MVNAKPVQPPARADLDYEDVKSGFMTGKTAALADWSFRKEQKDFNRTIATLRATKWNKEHLDRHRASARKYAAKPEVTAAQLKASRDRRHARLRKEARVFVCAAPDCGVEFCRIPGTVKGCAPRWCGVACYNRTKYRQKTAGQKKSKCGCCGIAGHTLKACPQRFTATTSPNSETTNRRGDPATELCARLQSETTTGSHQRPDSGAEMERASPLRTSSPHRPRQTSGSSSL